MKPVAYEVLKIKKNKKLLGDTITLKRIIKKKMKREPRITTKQIMDRLDTLTLEMRVGFGRLDTRIDETNVKVDNLQTEIKAVNIKLKTTNTKMHNGFKQINNRIDNLVKKNKLKE
jgi:hypothetical protein